MSQQVPVSVTRELLNWSFSLPRAWAGDRAVPISPDPPPQQGRGRGRVGASHFTAQSMEACICQVLSYLPDKVDVEPCLVVEFVAPQEKGEGVGIGCAGITEVGSVHGGEVLLHLQR